MVISGQREEKRGSFRGRFGDDFRVGDHFGVTEREMGVGEGVDLVEKN